MRRNKIEEELDAIEEATYNFDRLIQLGESERAVTDKINEIFEERTGKTIRKYFEGLGLIPSESWRQEIFMRKIKELKKFSSTFNPNANLLIETYLDSNEKLNISSLLSIILDGIQAETVHEKLSEEIVTTEAVFSAMEAIHVIKWSKAIEDLEHGKINSSKDLAVTLSAWRTGVAKRVLKRVLS